MNYSKWHNYSILLCVILLMIPILAFPKDNHASKPKGFMGLDFSKLYAEDVQRLGLHSDKGLRIIMIVPKSAADKYGLNIDDVIVGIDNTEICNQDSIMKIISSSHVGDRITITYIRNGEIHKIPFVFGTAPKPQKPGKFTYNARSKQQIKELLDLVNEHNKIMGCLAIGKNNEVLYSQAIGYKSIEANLRADIDTKYRIGSISKMFTSVMIFQMIEEGKLTLKTKLQDFYPQIPNSDAITIQMMLRHNSGIYSFTELPDYLEWSQEQRSHDYLIEKIQSHKPAFSPGDKNEYSNSNFLLLGYIIEILDKCDYSVALENRITNKIGLQNTYYGSRIDVDKNEALSYQNLGYWQLNSETDMSVPGGAGAIVSTASDLIVFIEALFGRRLISKQSLKQMLQDNKGFGSGVFKMNLWNQTFYGHTGSIDSFRSIVIYNPQKHYSMAYLSNGVADIKVGIIALATSIVTNQKTYMPQFRSAVQIEDFGIFTGVFTNEKYHLEIDVTEADGSLYTQVSGQAILRMEAIGKREFECPSLGVIIEFNHDNLSFTLSQGGEKVLFERKE